MKNGQYVVETCIVLFVVLFCFVLFFSETLNTEIIIKPFFIQALYPF